MTVEYSLMVILQFSAWRYASALAYGPGVGVGTMVGVGTAVAVGTGLVGVGVDTLVGVGTLVGSRVGIGVAVKVGSAVFKEPRAPPNGDVVSSFFTVSAKGLKSVASADAVSAPRSTLVSNTSHPALP